jgi:hypothetical protein
MSGVLKKISKGVKKVFKKVVQVTKKIVNSKLFKAVAIAAVAYFAITAAPGILASMSSAGAAAGGAGALAPITTAAVPNLATGIGSTMVANTAGAAATAGTGVIGSIAAGAKAIGAYAAANPTLTSSVLTTGGQVLSGYAKSKEEEEAEDKRLKTLDENGSFKLQMEGRGDWTPADIGGVSSSAGEAELDAGSLSNRKESAISKVANVELNGKKQRKDYYDSSTNQYAQA